MPLTQTQIRQLQRDLSGVPIGKILCIVNAAIDFYVCWRKSQSDSCVRQLITDIEACVKGGRRQASRAR
jgi:hypothetical protein